MSPMKPNNAATVYSKDCNMAETNDNNFKIAAMNMFKLLKEYMNESINEIYENINSGMKKC